MMVFPCTAMVNMKALFGHPILLLAPLMLVLSGCSTEIPDKYIETGSSVVTGPVLEEEYARQNLWTYEWMRNDYLWADSMPALSEISLEQDPKRFFSALLYKGDRFSWIEPNQTYQVASLVDDFGFEVQGYLDHRGDTIGRLLWVSPSTDAYRKGLRRGQWVRITHRDTLSLTLDTGRLEQGRYRPVSPPMALLPAEDRTGTVLLDTIYTFDDRSVGYFVYLAFNDEGNLLFNPYRSELRRLMATFKSAGVTDLIIDLRYNPGGYVSICQFLSGLLIPDNVLGTLSGYHAFNARRAAIQLEKTGMEEEALFFSLEKQRRRR